MNNYNLEDFKAWLEEKPERKENLTWDNNFARIGSGFKQFIQGVNVPGALFSSSSWQPYWEVVLKWKAEVDQQAIQKLNLKLQQDNQDLLKDTHALNQKNHDLQSQLNQKQQRVLALEADKQDLIQQLSQQKQKHQNYLSQEKTFLHQEITLIKEVLND